jgi:adenylate cyclase
MSDSVTDSGDRLPRGWIALAAGVLLLPVAALALLLARPQLDHVWEHQPSHFWLVLGTAAVSFALAYITNEAATRRGDARVLLVSLAFMASAGFLGLHALATPGVLLSAPNMGFVVATPIGLAIASVFAFLSVSPWAGPRASLILRWKDALRWSLIGVIIGWAAISLARLPPLDGPPPAAEVEGPLIIAAVVGLVLFAFSAWRYWSILRARPSIITLAMAVAFVLLAEAMLAVALSRRWHLSWWEWHVLMTLAFAAIVLGVREEYRRTRSLGAAFGGLYLEQTLARLDHWHGRAIAELAALQADDRPTDRLLDSLRQDGASADELRLLQEAAAEMRRTEELFRPYVPLQLAQRLPSDPALARLGGEEREVSVLFADLAGFTSFSESRPPTDVLHMLNSHWATVVPIIDRAGGVIEHFAGDGVMVIFNAVGEQPDHALRAARSALEIIAATGPLAEANPGWPRFRIGVNTGPAVVGNVGAEGRRTFGAIGDTSNLGARLMSAGEPSQVVMSASTREAVLRAGLKLQATHLGEIAVKGKQQRVDAWVLHTITADQADATEVTNSDRSGQ